MKQAAWGKHVPKFGEDDKQKQREKYEGGADERQYVFGCMEAVDEVQRYLFEEDVWPRKR